MTFEEKLIKAHKQGLKILLWNSVEWAYQEIEDIRQASKKDAKYCELFDGQKCKEGQWIYEIKDDVSTIQFLECAIECDTIIVKEIDPDEIQD